MHKDKGFNVKKQECIHGRIILGFGGKGKLTNAMTDKLQNY